jgi:hypothetical protein
MDAAVCSPAGPAWWWQAIRHRRTSLMSGALCRQSPRDPWVHTPANMALLICYLPFRSSACTRRRAACKTAVSALSRRSCVQRGRSWSRKTSVACCVITELLRVDRSVCPKGAKGDSPGQSEAPPWVRLRDGSIGSPALDDPFGPNLVGFRGR